MDPHSRRSQFNSRAPKAGPQMLGRFADQPQTKPSLTSKASKKSSSASLSSLLLQRPIATNSRVKQDEQYKNDMYIAFINNALLQKAKGVSGPFDELVENFTPKHLSDPATSQPSQVRRWLLGLSHVVSRLERTHSTLVDAIVNMPWVTMDNSTVKSYTTFIAMLLSARPEYLSLVLGKITQGFTHQFSIQALDDAPPETSSSPLTRREVYERLHYLLRHILSIIPTLSSTLMPLLTKNFPHKRQKQHDQSSYIRNLLRVSSYCPELSDKILSVIIDRAIQMDVEIQVEIEELDEEENTIEDQDVFEIDPFDTVVGQDPESDSDEDDEDGGNFDDFDELSSDGEDDEASEAEVPTNVRHIKEMVQKLDTILTLVFDHFRGTHDLLVNATTNGEGAVVATSTSELPPLPPLAFPLTPLLDLSFSPFPSPSTEFPTPISTSILRPASPASFNTTLSLSQSEAKRNLRHQFHTLLAIFDRTILRTFKSRYTQFLIFWYSSLDPEFSDTFQGMLVDTALFQPNTPTVTKAAAASYIGSFVSRATFVGTEGVRTVVQVLCEFLKSHLDAIEEILLNSTKIEADAVLSNVDKNIVFYSACQAVFLIFCFRWRDLLDMDAEDEGEATEKKSGKKWLHGLDVVHRVVKSVLNPLRACSDTVTRQFARVAHATDFLYCYTILDSNRRSEYAAQSSPSKNDGSPHVPKPVHAAVLAESINAELNSFFPFDPCKLPKSNAYIKTVYREWAAVAIDMDDDEEESEDEQEEETGMAVSLPSGSVLTQSASSQLDIPRRNPRANDGELQASLDAMSISPARPRWLDAGL